MSVPQNAGNAKAKHRGWKCQDGHIVHTGNILATQNKTNWHPGLNVRLNFFFLLYIHTILIQMNSIFKSLLLFYNMCRLNLEEMEICLQWYREKL